MQERAELMFTSQVGAQITLPEDTPAPVPATESPKRKRTTKAKPAVKEESDGIKEDDVAISVPSASTLSDSDMLQSFSALLEPFYAGKRQAQTDGTQWQDND